MPWNIPVAVSAEKGEGQTSAENFCLLSKVYSVVIAIILTEASRIAARATAHSWASPGVKESWSRVQLYVLVLLSLTVNVVLIALGYVIKNRRGKTSVALLTHAGYFVADLAATAALITLLKRQSSGRVNALQVFWAPFLLSHLGSTETIAANFFDKKKLFRLYTLGLIIQIGIACYIFGRFEGGSDNTLARIAIPITISGIIKCLERLCILRFSRFQDFTISTLSGVPPNKFKPKPAGGQSEQSYEQLDDHLDRKSIIPEARHLHRAYLSFMMFMPLFSDINVRIYNTLSGIFSLNKDAKEAFNMVDFELNLLFDVLYTKTIMHHVLLGFILRFIYFFLSTGALLAFPYAYAHKQHHSSPEIIMTYMLLLGEFLADGTAVISHILSGWTMQWLTTPTIWGRLPRCVRPYIAYCMKFKMSMQGQGVNYMAQHSLLNYCLKAKVNKFNAAIKKLVDAKRILKVFWDIQKHAWVDVRPTWALVDPGLKELILSRLQKKRKKYDNGKFKFSCLSNLVQKGASDVLKDKGIEIYEELHWSLTKVEFTHSLLLWHIATDILFHYHKRRYPGSCSRNNNQISKKLSDYMMHLLVMHSQDLAQVAPTLLELDNIKFQAFFSVPEGGGEGGKSVFFKGCDLAKQLHSFTVDARWDPEELWEMISCVWLEMLFSAAYDCDW
ncbi:PREDICTED: uncharacterized protein LOC18596247 [Theobroma cacao]|uniref:Uncharacterized protein LOC18596247 n=1 Tax=Theobroma cacao TaxID=3641 RepID=A0AB32WG74_THECC|nr:PREDICTED: uncharacterized protein LOC18596247 [Theobroma cacao]